MSTDHTATFLVLPGVPLVAFTVWVETDGQLHTARTPVIAIRMEQGDTLNEYIVAAFSEPLAISVWAELVAGTDAHNFDFCVAPLGEAYEDVRNDMLDIYRALVVEKFAAASGADPVS